MNIKQRLKESAIRYMAISDEINGSEYKSAFIFDSVKMSFIKDSYESIKKNNEWNKRLSKQHPQLKGVKEMQSSNSSDALLMNIFCYPNMLDWKGIRSILKVNKGDQIIFGWNPIFKNENILSPTEIDMKIGSSIFEAKLTEESFKAKNIRVVKLYENFDDVFDFSKLKIINEEIASYQLIRNILTADKYDFTFSIIVDQSRTDLIRELFELIKAIKKPLLASRVNFITWQEIADNCGSRLKSFLEMKYL